MDDKPTYPPPQQTNYILARDLARQRLTALDFNRQCERAGISLAPEGVAIRLIDRRYFLDRATLALTAMDSGPEPEIWEQIILLHYLATATGAPAAGELISYQQIADGAPYYPTFLKRTSGILLSAFGSRLEALVPAAASLGGHERSDLGDLAVTLPVLSRIEIVAVAWHGDQEFPPEIRLLFDRHITNYLPTEDITVLCQMLCLKMARAKP